MRKTATGRSYVYELFRGCYLPEFKAYRIWITEKITGNDCGIWRRDENLSSALKEIENRFYACPCGKSHRIQERRRQILHGTFSLQWTQSSA